MFIDKANQIQSMLKTAEHEVNYKYVYIYFTHCFLAVDIIVIIFCIFYT